MTTFFIGLVCFFYGLKWGSKYGQKITTEQWLILLDHYGLVIEIGDDISETRITAMYGEHWYKNKEILHDKKREKTTKTTT